ncbi:MAG TPA: transglutaminase domain-containing protein [Bacteroidia bacterium]|nr:transglutaminase domain-containing protein [Bacteroidia bacterium]
MKKSFSIVLGILVSSFCFSQNSKSEFSAVDEKVLNLPSYNSENLDSLSNLLTKDFSTDIEKVRAVYVWVANNISYNVPKYEERSKLANAIQKKADLSESAENIIQKRKAVCEGYSNLMKALCNSAGITCEVIEGIGRPEKTKSDLHAWNAVKTGGEWKLLDATWSSGGINMNKNKFEKRFDDTFFLVPPGEFIKTHYPFDPMWQLLSQPVKRKEFSQSKTFSSDSAIFNFTDSINYFFQQDSISQLISLNRRAYEFDPGNNFARLNIKNVINYRENEKMTDATIIFEQGINQYNQCTEIINEARKKRSTKKLNANEIKLKQLIKDSRQNISKAVEMYNTVKFVDSSNSRILKLNTENGKNNLKQLDQLEKYLEKYFSTPDAMRIRVL